MPRLPARVPLAAPQGVRRGSPILVETENFRLRTMEGAADAGSPFMDWLADADVLRGLNLPRRSWTVEGLRHFIDGFDRIGRHLVGIRDRSSDKLIGFYTLDVNMVHRTAQITAAVGDSDYVGRNVLYEATPPFIRYLFEKRAIDKVSARVLASNRRVLFNFMIPDVFQFEARLRQEVLTQDGKRADLLVFAAYKNP